MVRSNLQEQWHNRRLDNYRETLNERWHKGDEYRTLLSDTHDKLRPHSVHYLCNKVVPFYYLQSAQGVNNLGHRHVIRRQIVASLYEEWSRHYHGSPNIEYEYFIANLIRITPTGPSTLKEIITAHRSICAQTPKLLKMGKESGQHVPGRPSATYENFKLLPLYRAIILVLDEIYNGDAADLPGGEYWISLSKYARRQTVLVVRTALFLEEDLDDVISLEPLRA